MSIGLTYYRIALSRWRLIASIVLGCTAVAWAVSAFYLTTKPTFEASARLNIVPTAEELGYATRFVRGSTFDGGSVLLGTYAEFAHTRPVVEPIVDRWIAQQAAAENLDEEAWVRAHSVPNPFSPGRLLAILNYGEAPVVPLRQDLIDSLVKGTTIENVEGTYLMQLTVEWDDPRSAAWFANQLADAIIARAERESRASGREIAGSLDQRLETKQAELAAVLRQSRDAKSSIGVVDVERQKTGLIEARLTEQAQLTTDRAALDASRSQLAALRRQTGGKLTAAQPALEQTLALETPRAAGLERSVATREARIRQLDAQIAALGPRADRILALDDRATQLRQEVAALTERLGFSQTENLANAPRVQLIERAAPPLTRSSPKIFFNTVLGFIAGCALAAGIVLLVGPGPSYRADGEPETDTDPDVPADDRATAAIHRFPALAYARRATDWVAAPVAGTSALAIDPATTPADRVFARALPRPRDGHRYQPLEIAALAPVLAPLLASDDRPVFVTAAGDDRDAEHLGQLVNAVLDRAGPVHAVDATRPASDWSEGAGRTFVYLGGLTGSARGEAIARIPADARLIAAADAVDWRAASDFPATPAADVVRFAG